MALMFIKGIPVTYDFVVLRSGNGSCMSYKNISVLSQIADCQTWPTGGGGGVDSGGHGFLLCDDDDDDWLQTNATIPERFGHAKYNAFRQQMEEKIQNKWPLQA